NMNRQKIFLHNIFMMIQSYGYEHVYSFGRSGCGDFVCFDYRDDPKGSEPKFVL
ncbi:hypothetical protein AAUPMG_02927, partial [Pasteurella multocida subsp. multocida str. Anand1_goat]